MTKIEYFKYALKEKLLMNIKWYFSVLTIPAENIVTNDYISYDNGKYYAIIGNELEEITDAGETIFLANDKITLTKDDIINIKDKVDTTIGRAIINYTLVAYPFKDKIEYINSKITIKTIESKMLELFKNDVISIDEYIEFVDATIFLSNISRIVVVSATSKNMTQSPGIAEYKNKLKEEYSNKYGPDWMSDIVLITEYEDKLKKYDDEYLKDDPTFGKLLSGKVKNVGRVKTMINYGKESDANGNIVFIEEPLVDGWPKDPNKLATLFNSSRMASYSRGSETAVGGTISKVLLRVTNAFRVSNNNDCGTKKGIPIKVTEANKIYLIKRYIIESGKVIKLTKDNIDKYVNSIVTLRSPTYCLENGNSFCETCVGDNLRDNKDAIPQLVLGVGGALLTISLKKMHGTTLALTTLDPLEELT